ncbi:hypothetical protein ACK83U_18660 [Rhizobium sp. WW22]|uniref:hypothetical protein n=1 Tax=Rhizobium sp. WW22 TaxID=3389070 RepID=UPI000DD886AD
MTLAPYLPIAARSLSLQPFPAGASPPPLPSSQRAPPEKNILKEGLPEILFSRASREERVRTLVSARV